MEAHLLMLTDWCPQGASIFWPEPHRSLSVNTQLYKTKTVPAYRTVKHAVLTVQPELIFGFVVHL